MGRWRKIGETRGKRGNKEVGREKREVEMWKTERKSGFENPPPPE